MNNRIEKWTSLKEIQTYLGVGRETILQWIAKREMPAYKVGRLWKFKISEVDKWIRSGGASDYNYKMETTEEKINTISTNKSSKGENNGCNQ